MVKQIIKAADYLNRITVHSYMASVFLTGNGIFQQDCALYHKAQLCWSGLRSHQDEFKLMSWPPNLPDLNQIEHILDIMILSFHHMVLLSIFNKKTFIQFCIQQSTFEVYNCYLFILIS